MKIGVSYLDRYPLRKYIQLTQQSPEEDDGNFMDWQLLKSVKNNEFYEVMEWLERGANSNAVFLLSGENLLEINITELGEELKVTPLMIAAYYGHVWIAKLLIEDGADPYFENEVGDTALIWAAFKGHDEFLLAMPLHDVIMNKANSFGNTPLMAAADGGQRSCVYILLTYGADVLEVNNSGYNTLNYAEGELRKDLVRWSKMSYEKKIRKMNRYFEEMVKPAVNNIRVNYNLIMDRMSETFDN